MKNLIGAKIGIYLKDNDSVSSDIDGVLTYIDEKHVYIQTEDINKIVIIPRVNVKYYISDRLPGDNMLVMKGSQNHQNNHAYEAYKEVTQDIRNQEQEQQDPDNLRPEFAKVYNIYPNQINVYIDGDFGVSIPVPVTFKLHQWHEGIMNVVMRNPDVIQLLMGRVQTSMEYFTANNGAEVYITTREDPDAHLQNQNQAISGNASENSFSMTSSGVASRYLSPTEMVSKLDNIARKSKK